MKKTFADKETALDGLLFDGMTIMAGGFGPCGVPQDAISAIYDSGVRDLTLISNNCGGNGFGLGILLADYRVKKVIGSYIGANKEFERQYISGELALEFSPQGTLAERIRAGGAGIPAFYTATGVGTLIAEGKETKEFDGRKYLMETGLTADLAIVKAWRADAMGNLQYRKTARNFNPNIATAGKITVVEAEEIVAEGSIAPDEVHTPGIYVNRMFVGKPTGLIEQRMVRPRVGDAAKNTQELCA